MIINYDVFSSQSETCSLELPDLDFEVGGGMLGGKFTTLEGKCY
jgi:C4-type Zn-finger protein